MLPAFEAGAGVGVALDGESVEHCAQGRVDFERGEGRLGRDEHAPKDGVRTGQALEGASQARDSPSRVTDGRTAVELPPGWLRPPAAPFCAHAPSQFESARPAAPCRRTGPHAVRLARVMALAEAPPAPADAREDSSAGWTVAEIEEAAALCAHADADAARWELADWLIARVPIGPRGRNGNYGRIDQLALWVGVSGVTLRQARATAGAWPPPTRVPCAAHHVHEKFRNGGAAHAAERRERVLSMDRNTAGRVTMPAFQRWRAAQQADGAPASPKRRTRAGAPPELADILQRVDALIDDLDHLIRADARPRLWRDVRAQLDSLSGEVERIAVALSAAA